MSEEQLPILQDHQAPSADNSGSQAGYEPTKEEKADIKLATTLYERSKRARKAYDQHWLDDYKFFRGKQWKEQRPSYRHSEVINMVFQNIQSTVPIQLDSRPRLEFLPKHPADTELGAILNEVAEADWVDNNWLMQIAEMLYDGNIYGSGLAGIEWDPKQNYGVGGKDFYSADPFYCFPDPNAPDINHKRSKFFVYAEPYDLDQLKSEYPDKAKFIKPDLQDLVQGNKQDLDQVRFKSPTDTKVTIEGSSAYEVGNANKALKITAWIKSDEFIEEAKDGPEDPETGVKQQIFEQKLKYPNGRKIVIAGGVLLSSGPNPYDDGLFPYAKYQNYILPREFWGMSEIEQLRGPQKIFNKLVSFALDIYTLMGNPIWVVDTTSGIDTDNLFNRPGLVVEKEPNTEVRREQGLDIHPTLLSFIDRIRNWFNETSGATDLSRGVENGQITAGVAIQSLQEAAQTRLRQKARNLDAFLQDFGKLWLSRTFQFMSSPQIIRITKNQDAQKYFKFHVETQMDDQGNPVLNDAGDPVRKVKITQFGQDPTSGQAVETDAKEYLINAGFDVRISTGSTLPFAKAEKSNLSITLFKLNAIDRTELLKSVEYPNWEAVAQRMDQLDQQKQQQQIAMMQAKQGGGQPPAGQGGPPPAA